MFRFLLGVLIAIALLPWPAFADTAKIGLRVTTQTTTTLQAAVVGKSVYILQGSLCVDGNGAATGMKLQDSAGTNLAGTVIQVVNPGACWAFLPRTQPAYLIPTASGTSLQLVTTVGNGPVEIILEIDQR